jgi:HSP20 family protein
MKIWGDIMENKENLDLKSNETKDEEINTKKTDESPETSLNDIISTIRDKQEEFTQMLSDYTNYSKKTLVDVIETDNSVIIIADLPRLKKEDVEIAISEDTIDIRAEFEKEVVDEDMNYIQRERSSGKIRRSIKLPSKVMIKEAQGTFKDSVLTIKLPKLLKKTLKLKID